jgi:hypothetical protein
MAKKISAKKSISSKSDGKSALQELQLNLTTEESHLINLIWQYYEQNGKWPMTRLVHSQNDGKQKVRNILRKLGGDIVRETQNHPVAYELTLIGSLLTKHGEKYFQLIVNYFAFLHKKYLQTPEVLTFSDKDIVAELKLSESDRKLLGFFIEGGGLLSGGGGRGPDNWTVNVPDIVEDLDEPLSQSVEALLLKTFQKGKPVFREDQWKQNNETSPLLLSTPLNESDYGQHFASSNSGVDALKRRYQVFVSSTFEDLKEERQSVIHALLESKCIPTGMELFPAASMEQWEIIKRIIEECDYYVVIVAGRYGSLNGEGVSFTEMEFDYACKIGKPVIGFYHRNPKSLPGSKLEDTDKAKKLLATFTDKIKKRLCRPWSSSAELGSAIKSAIFSELEIAPQSGWIRGDAVPTSQAIEKMKQRIADLEEQLKEKKLSGKLPSSGKLALPEGNEFIEIPITINYDFQSVSKSKWDGGEEREAKKTLQTTISMTWDDLFLILADRLHSKTSLRDIHTSFNHEIYDTIKTIVIQQLGDSKIEYEHSSSYSKLELVMKTLMAKKLVKMLPASGYYYEPVWQFTPKGFQYQAELEASRSHTGKLGRVNEKNVDL